MVFDKDGRKRGHRFLRGLMRSAAALAYEQAQAAIDGSPDDTTGPLLDPVLRPLWGAYGSLTRGARPSARPSTSICPSARSCSTSRAACAASSPLPASTRIG